jgi:hypothetical protein
LFIYIGYPKFRPVHFEEDFKEHEVILDLFIWCYFLYFTILNQFNSLLLWVNFILYLKAKTEFFYIHQESLILRGNI